MRLQEGNMSVFGYVAKFKECYKFFTIYQHNSDEVRKYIKFKGGLQEDILASIGPMEIWGYAALVNKSRLVEEYNKKLMVNRYSRDDSRKKLAPQEQKFKPTRQPKRNFQFDNNKGK